MGEDGLQLAINAPTSKLVGVLQGANGLWKSVQCTREQARGGLLIFSRIAATNLSRDRNSSSFSPSNPLRTDDHEDEDVWVAARGCTRGPGVHARTADVHNGTARNR